MPTANPEYAYQLRKSGQGTGEGYRINMDRLRAVASRWRRRPIDILITEIGTQES